MVDNRMAQVTINGYKPEPVLVDLRAEPVILGKHMVQHLKMQGVQVGKSNWQIHIAGGGVEQLHGETVLPLNIDLKPGTREATRVQVRCLLTEATKYDVLLGMEALFRFFINLGTENAYYRPDWTRPMELACITLDLHSRQGPRHALVAQSNLQVVCKRLPMCNAFHGVYAAEEAAQESIGTVLEPAQVPSRLAGSGAHGRLAASHGRSVAAGKATVATCYADVVGAKSFAHCAS